MKDLIIALCDDEGFARDSISVTIEKFFESKGTFCRVKRYGDSKKLFADMKKEKFDLLLLDVDMPDMDGIALGKALRVAGNRTEIIYISNREDRVFESFAVRPFGFIRKNNFIKDTEVVLSSFYANLSQKISTVSDGDLISFTVGTSVVSYKVSDISYIEAQGREQIIHFYDGHAETVRYTLKDMEEKLSPYGFKRVHKAFIINGAAISVINQNEIITTDGSSVPINSHNANDIKKWYLNRLKNNGTIML